MTDATARRIASEWHCGQGSALYALASTGAIAHPFGLGTTQIDEINDELAIRHAREFLSDADAADLIALREYCAQHGPRGPVPGWHTLSW